MVDRVPMMRLGLLVMGSHNRFDKECATYAMEATQHLLVLANLGLIYTGT